MVGHTAGLLPLQVDVLVGVHGSALTNAMFMRRGSSLIELRPYGFSGRESWPNIYMKSQTRHMEVFWYGIDVMDRNLSTPGAFEQVSGPHTAPPPRAPTSHLARPRTLPLAVRRRTCSPSTRAPRACWRATATWGCPGPRFARC